MLKFNLPMSKLTSAIALSLFASAASADTIYSTKHYLLDETNYFIGTDGYDSEFPYGNDDVLPGNWLAGYFYVPKAQTDPTKPATVCQNGCDITGASLYLIDRPPHPVLDPFSFEGLTLQVYSNAEGLNGWNKYPGDPLFTLTNPEPTPLLGTEGGPGTLVSFTAAQQDQNSPALLQPGTGYWLMLSRDSASNYPYDLAWYYNGHERDGEAYAAYYGGGEGSPYIFEITGTNSATPRLSPSNVPLPGAAWLMGSALIGFTIAGRRKQTN